MEYSRELLRISFPTGPMNRSPIAPAEFRIGVGRISDPGWCDVPVGVEDVQAFVVPGMWGCHVGSCQIVCFIRYVFITVSSSFSHSYPPIHQSIHPGRKLYFGTFQRGVRQIFASGVNIADKSAAADSCIRIAVTGISNITLFSDMILRFCWCCWMQRGASEYIKRQKTVVIKISAPGNVAAFFAFGSCYIHIFEKVFSVIYIALKCLSELPHVAGALCRASAFACALQRGEQYCC